MSKGLANECTSISDIRLTSDLNLSIISTQTDHVKISFKQISSIYSANYQNNEEFLQQCVELLELHI